MSDREQIKAYYDTSPETEWARLEQNPWEFEINCRYIDRYVQPGQSVLDLGGGPGRYSIHLAERERGPRAEKGRGGRGGADGRAGGRA